MFDRDNIEPTPNPKPITVQRITRTLVKDGVVVGHEHLIVRNICVDPKELLLR